MHAEFEPSARKSQLKMYQGNKKGYKKDKKGRCPKVQANKQ